MLYARRVAAEYRLTCSPQKIPCKLFFETAFLDHSKFYNQLSVSEKKQLWKDFDFWHPIRIQGYVADWLHMFVNMLLPGDPIYCNKKYQDLFLKPDPIPPITGEQRVEILRMFNLDVPSDWKL